MEYEKKVIKWKGEMLKEDSDVKFIAVSGGKAVYADKNGSCQPDFMYYCVQKKGRRIAEHFWRKHEKEAVISEEKFLLKKQKKLIFIHEEEVYGFGFNDKEQDKSIVLYVRRGCAAMLVWSDSDGKVINTMYEINEECPESLDTLTEFMIRETDCSGIAEGKESEDFR